MADQLSIEIKNDLAELDRLYQALDQFGETHRLSAKVMFDLHLALDELLTNVISYGYDDSREHRIKICISSRKEEVVLQIEDDARPFDPTAREAPDMSQSLGEKPIGGLGIYLVCQLMDGWEYTRQGDRNILVLKKSTMG